MNIIKATNRFEAFLAEHGKLLSDDLAVKHVRMAEDEFSFLRATFYRWSQQFPVVCGNLMDAPRVLGVGDLHVENFGTWRDAEGRLVWGINDFDEACKLPYVVDLVRLAVSTLLAVESCRLEMDAERVCGAILDGYSQGMAGDGEPFVLAERHCWLAALATDALKDPAKFWDNLQRLPEVKKRPSAEAIAGIRRLLPERKLPYRLVRRVAGLGSLGKQRVVAVANWNGSVIAREAKAITPSAWTWATKGTADQLLYESILDRAVRSRDPWVQLRGQWLIRRLAPDCGRVDLAALVRSLDAEHLLRAMGRETANIHHGSPKALNDIRKDLTKREAHWLRRAAKAMIETLRADWKEWQAAQPRNRSGV